MEPDKLGLKEVCSWLKREVPRIKFGTLTVKYVLHDSKIKRIEQSVSTSLKIEE